MSNFAKRLASAATEIKPSSIPVVIHHFDPIVWTSINTSIRPLIIARSAPAVVAGLAATLGEAGAVNFFCLFHGRGGSSSFITPYLESPPLYSVYELALAPGDTCCRHSGLQVHGVRHYREICPMSGKV